MIVPPTTPTELDDLKATASDIDLVQWRSEAKAIEQAPGAAAC